MTHRDPQQPELLEWAVASRPMDGQVVCGDAHLAEPFDRGVLLAAVDGIGHGEEAVAVAQDALAVLKSHAAEPVAALMRRCHDALVRTRGAVMTLASVQADDRAVSWLSVGNVDGRLFRADPGARPPSEGVMLRSGLVGLQLPALQPTVMALARGDLLILATDGIRAGYEAGLNLGELPQRIADRILKQYFKGTDDGLVLVARYVGVAP